MSGWLKAGDTISGQEAIAKMTVKDANGNSNIEDMFWAKDLEATVEVNKTDVYTLGKRGAQHKPHGWSGSGSMTIYYVTSLFTKLGLQYAKTGKPVYFDIMIVNDDPGSTVGKQTVILKDCTLDSFPIAKLDVESEVLDASVDFTFDDYDLLDEFKEPTLGY